MAYDICMDREHDPWMLKLNRNGELAHEIYKYGNLRDGRNVRITGRIMSTESDPELIRYSVDIRDRCAYWKFDATDEWVRRKYARPFASAGGKIIDNMSDRDHVSLVDVIMDISFYAFLDTDQSHAPIFKLMAGRSKALEIYRGTLDVMYAVIDEIESDSGSADLRRVAHLYNAHVAMSVANMTDDRGCGSDPMFRNESASHEVKGELWDGYSKMTKFVAYTEGTRRGYVKCALYLDGRDRMELWMKNGFTVFDFLDEIQYQSTIPFDNAYVDVVS